jgi:hypothetical protein
MLKQTVHPAPIEVTFETLTTPATAWLSDNATAIA